MTKEPSSPLIVEGANIFITSDARTKLFEVGKVAIVKDSSANKVRLPQNDRTIYNVGLNVVRSDNVFLRGGGLHAVI